MAVVKQAFALTENGNRVVSAMAIFQQLSHSYYRIFKHCSESSPEILDSFQRNVVIQALTLQLIISSAC